MREPPPSFPPFTAFCAGFFAPFRSSSHRACTAWEIATKQRLGKLESVPQAAQRYAELVAADGFVHLPMTYLHSLRAGAYAVKHRDPFDRMLAAQGELELLTLVTRDTAFDLFDVETLW